MKNRSIRHGTRKGGTRIQRRPRLDPRHRLDPEDIRSGRRDPHRGPRRRAGDRRPGGTRCEDGRARFPHLGRARRVRGGVRLPRPQGRRHLRGPVPAAHGIRPAADGEEARGGRPPGRGRRGRPRLHGQRERPGALRRGHQDPLIRQSAPHHRPGPALADDAGRGEGVCQGARRRDPFYRQTHLFHRPQPLGRRHRGRGPRRHVGRTERGRLPPDQARLGNPGHAPGNRDRLRTGHPGVSGRRDPERRGAHRPAELAGRPARRGPHRPPGKPAGRHQVARGVRDARRGGTAHLTAGARNRGARPRSAPTESSHCPAVLGPRVRRTLVHRVT